MSPLTAIFPARLELAELMAHHHAQSFSEPWDAESFERILALPGAFGFLISISGKSAGFILARLAAEEAEILTLAIDAEHRRKALALKLLVAALDEARTRGAREMFLEVAEDNDPALSLYRAVGFAEVGRRSGYYKEAKTTKDALTLRRPL